MLSIFTRAFVQGKCIEVLDVVGRRSGPYDICMTETQNRFYCSKDIYMFNLIVLL